MFISIYIYIYIYIYICFIYVLLCACFIAYICLFVYPRGPGALEEIGRPRRREYTIS